MGKNGKVCVELPHGKVRDVNVVVKGAVGSCAEALALGVAVKFVVQMVGTNAVGHIDITVPRTVQPPGTGFGIEVENGVVVVGRERAGLKTTVESKDAETELGL